MKRLGKKFLANESGAVAIVVALLFPVFCGLAALAIDYGQMVSERRELNKAAEAGALSGARALWPLNLITATYEDRTTPKYFVAEPTAITTATANLPTTLPTGTTDVVTAVAGRWDYNKTFNTGDKANANGVYVTIRRNNVSTWFSKFISNKQIDITGSATAVCDFAGGTGTMPIVLGKNQNAPLEVGKDIIILLNPAPFDNGGWFLKGAAPNTNDLKTEINRPEGTAPIMSVGDLINLSNGVNNSALEALEAKWRAATTAGKSFIVPVPVVDNAKFVDNQAPILTFVEFEITFVNAAPWEDNLDKTARIEGKIRGVDFSSSALPGSNSGGTGTDEKSGVLALPKLVPYPPPIP